LEICDNRGYNVKEGWNDRIFSRSSLEIPFKEANCLMVAATYLGTALKLIVNPSRRREGISTLSFIIMAENI
jgi:hypothetical protein